MRDMVIIENVTFKINSTSSNRFGRYTRRHSRFDNRTDKSLSSYVKIMKLIK